MRLVKYILSAMLMLACMASVSAKGYKQCKVYMFGIATSFNDSTVYFTDVQVLDTACVRTDRTHFLINRADYSYQLRDYLKKQGQSTPTCITVYSTDEKQIYKKFIKIRNKYEKKMKSSIFIKDIPTTDFAYRILGPDEGTMIVDAKEAEAAAQKSERDMKKRQKKAMKGQGPRPDGNEPGRPAPPNE